MFTIRRNRKIAAPMLLLALVIILALGYFFRRQGSEPEICVVADIMYLVPEDETKVEDLVKPDRLLANRQNYSIATTSEWGCVNLLASEKKAKAVIIHHAAVDLINLDELQHLFKRERFIVVGIGIPGNELAEIVGIPSLYDKRMGTYNSSAYFFAYSIKTIEKPFPSDDVNEANHNAGEAMVILGYRKSTNTLREGDENIASMLWQIEGHIFSVNQ